MKWFGRIEKNWNEFVKKVWDRHFGIGADGLMFCSESKIADIKIFSGLENNLN